MSWVAIAVMTYHDHKELGNESVHFPYISWATKQELKLGRNLEAGADKKDTEECHLLVYSSWLSLVPRTTSLQDYTRCWALSFTNWENAYYVHLRRVWSYGGIFSVQDPSFQMTLACVKLMLNYLAHFS